MPINRNISRDTDTVNAGDSAPSPHPSNTSTASGENLKVKKQVMQRGTDGLLTLKTLVAAKNTFVKRNIRHGNADKAQQEKISIEHWVWDTKGSSSHKIGAKEFEKLLLCRTRNSQHLSSSCSSDNEDSGEDVRGFAVYDDESLQKRSSFPNKR
eukprot:CAMPEP_0179475066 /NCGR_PEP_ID=MMETSP0799-20121207/54363_1 /TAXON_ID=46947 /ORGANISM="Geminigera cryophila, Strain CCMP2564" /LENGTH=153 /DNA_ID=CAMNT_0021284439 /DNA_START=110 /DNA_END=567 /DNA_ORIENTATION=+